DEIMRRIKSRGRQDEIDAGEAYWRSLYDAYLPFIDFVKSEVQGDLNYIELDLSNPEFINTPSMIDAFINDVRKFFPDK
ncbi:MAG: deoxynucleoside kinase, partial [Synergistaceae bacterium]|nr:deoxynucleoside kinase [Synergistaceae bacterium]